MKCFEYIRLDYDGTLDEFCALGSHGWEIIVAVGKTLIMKRELIEADQIEITRKFYRERNNNIKGT